MNTETHPQVAILLSTYNGGAYLQQQLQSLVQQSYRHWVLFARDDGSEDDSGAILRQQARQDSRIHLLDNPNKINLGAKDSYAKLLSHGLNSKAEIFFLCDQDDVWHPEKLEQQFAAFGTSETPQLVYCNFIPVDQQLRPVSGDPSLCSLPPPATVNVSNFLSRNLIPGCCMAFNAALARIALPVPKEAVLHDSWLALAGAATGALVQIDLPLVQYRQHGTNTIGHTTSREQLLSPRSWGKYWTNGHAELQATIQQAGILAERLGSDNDVERTILKRYNTILELSRYQRLKLSRLLGLRQEKLLDRLVLYLRLITLQG